LTEGSTKLAQQGARVGEAPARILRETTPDDLANRERHRRALKVRFGVTHRDEGLYRNRRVGREGRRAPEELVERDA